MAGLNFHETVRGARFFDAQIPQLIKAITRLAAAVEENNELRKKEMAPSKKEEQV